MGYGPQRVFHQIAAVVNGDDANSLGQGGGIEFLNRATDAIQHLAGVFTPAHQHNALDTA